MFNWISTALFARVLFVTGILLLALGGWLYYDALPEPLCTMEQPEREVEAAPGQVQEIVFTITNPSKEVARIVGLVPC